MKHLMQGFTLIEVLISVLIMSVGVLGATGLQLRGLDANRDSFYRTEATQLVSNIANRIEVNPVAASDYVHTINAVIPIVLIAPAAAAKNCQATPCSPTEMADYDVTQWLCSINSVDAGGVVHPACSATAPGLNIQSTLPKARGSIVLSTDGSEYLITVEWTNDKAATVSSVNLTVGVPSV